MHIPHLTHPERSKFYPVVRNALRGAGVALPLAVNLGESGGYSGSLVATLHDANETEFVTDMELSDWTRFPARIRAAATALRDAGRFGTFFMTHGDGDLRIAQLAAEG